MDLDRRNALGILLAALPVAACIARDDSPMREAVRPRNPDEQRFVRDLEAFIAGAIARFPTLPGLSIAVARSDGPLFVNAFGRADIEAGVAATPATRFYLASSTKSFVGLALALLDARGTIDLDWTLAELAPGVRFDPVLRAGEITLRHMLSHTHGFDQEGMAERLAYTGEHDAETLWGLLPRLVPNPEAPLGTFDYGNIGYNVATLLLERRLGRSWQQLLETELFRPLGLTQTHARGLADARARHTFTAPYHSLEPNGPVRLYLVKEDDIMQSAGGLFTSANDAARWLQLNLAAANGRPTALPAAVVAATHRPVATFSDRFQMFERTGYGLGWYSGDYGGATLYHSFGGYVGARSHVSFMPSLDVGVAALSNDEGIGYILVDVIAAYVYDWFGQGPEAAERAGRTRIENLAGRAQGRPAEIAAERARRAQRPWQLSLPRAAYAGRYCNPDYGTLRVSERDGRLAMAMGRTRSAIEPYTEPETVRIEPIPGTGIVMRFRIENGSVAAAEVDGDSFRRC